MSLRPIIYHRRMKAAYQDWKRERGIFYKSPTHDFLSVVAALEKHGLLRNSDMVIPESELEPEDAQPSSAS